MGNQQSNIMASCVVAADDTLNVASKAAKCPSPAEIDAYTRDVKQVVLSQVEDAEDRYKRYLEAFTPKAEDLKQTTADFVDELNIGLACHKRSPTGHTNAQCSLKMLDAFVPKPPSGREAGTYYALDFGGSNFRILKVEMKEGKIKTTQKKATLLDCKTNLPKGLLDPKASATQMFDFFASVSEEFLQETGDLSKQDGQFHLGFTFSYPCVMRTLDSATLMVWTKGFETGRETEDPVEGCDVVSLINMAFRRRNLPLDVNCVANDTVGTLLSCAFTQDTSLPPCAVGMILGTGMNACYVEDRAPDWGYVGRIINLECGNFNRSLPTTNIDHEVDFADVGGRGRQHLEKMVSGAYLGEICRRAFVKILQYKAPTSMWRPYCFASEDAAIMIGDKSEAMVVVRRKCHERFHSEFSLKELRWLRDICEMVFRRAAALAACTIAATAIKTGRLQEAMGGLTVGIDGSLFKCNAFIRDDIRYYLTQILSARQASLIHLTFADDGSGIGAAILAAVADS